MRKIVIWVIVVLGAACRPQEPVRIIITPTPAHTATAEATEQAIALAASNTPEQPTPTLPPPTATPEPPTATPYATRTPIAGDGQFIGSILGPDSTPSFIVPTAQPMTAVPSTPLATLPPPVVVPSPSLDANRMGIQIYYNVDLENYQQVIWQAQQLRVGWVKFQADWSFLQPNAPDEISPIMRMFELQVQYARGVGLKTILSVTKAPAWARRTQQSQDGPPDDPQDLVRFLAILLERVKPEFIDAIEIWNEPNFRREWQGALPFNGGGYMQLFRPAYQFLRQNAPNVIVITAGLAPTGSSQDSVDDFVFLQQMYDAGLGELRDGIAVGVHPYGWGNPPDALCCARNNSRGWDDNPHFFFLETLNKYREIMNRNGHKDVQLWATEFGWATWEDFPTEPPDAWMTFNSPAQQAEYTLRAFEIGQSRADIGVMVLWNLNFANTERIEARSEKSAYSLLVPSFPDGGLRLRPLYESLRDRP